MFQHLRKIVFAITLPLMWTGFTWASDWPAWRGPHQDGTAVEVGIFTKWSDDADLRWKAEVPGAGSSCPIVLGSRVLLTSTSGRDHSQLHVLCYETARGELQWERKFFGTPTPVFTMFPPARGHAMPSLVSDGKIVVALFSTGELFGLNLQGQLLWTRSLAVDYGPFENDYGIAASPVIWNDRVLLQIDRTENAYLLAISLEDGSSLWKQDRHEISDNWATPVVTKSNGIPVVLCAGSNRLDGFHVTSGAPVWTVKGLARLCCPMPIPLQGSLIVTSGPGGNVQRLQLPTTSDGTPQTLWQSNKGAGFIPSAVCVDGLYFYGSDRGIASCIDLANGEEIWQQRIGGTYRSSPVAVNGHIYFTALDGKVTVIKAGRKYEEVAVNDLGESISASPAIADGALFFRGEKHLICIGSKTSPIARKGSRKNDEEPLRKITSSLQITSQVVRGKAGQSGVSPGSQGRP